nr:DUF3365 domain-containing protein [Desulfobulbaceae bacterium]
MKLRSKFILSIGAVILVSFGITFYRTSSFQNELVRGLAERQARMIAQQIVLTRKWVADHNGLFLMKGPGTSPNPFLDDPEVVDTHGNQYVKRNPAMVTRELSLYADKSDFCRFRVTSLKPVNPQNAPDDFEAKSLALFETGVTEVIEITHDKGTRFLRFISPLIVEQACLECHVKHGYKIGDVRGGLSLVIPIEWAYQAITRNNVMLLLVCLGTIFVVGLVIYLLLDQIVVRRLAFLSKSMDSFPELQLEDRVLVGGGDEVSDLSKKFFDLSDRLIASQEQLEQTREQVYQAEKMAAIGRLSAGIAHEINNPLGGMRNCVKSMTQNPSDRQLQSRYLGLLDKGLKRVETTLRQLLNFGRKEPLRLREVDVDELIRECLALMEYRFKDIDLNTNLNLSDSYLVDVEAFRQVIVNICLNALQSMPTGGSLKVSSTLKGEAIEVAVTDTGIGIDQENIREIFDPFYTSKGEGEGTGLGLTVSLALVQKMNGSIIVESKKGQGSCFKILLPIVSGKKA